MVCMVIFFSVFNLWINKIINYQIKSTTRITKEILKFKEYNVQIHFQPRSDISSTCKIEEHVICDYGVKVSPVLWIGRT